MAYLKYLLSLALLLLVSNVSAQTSTCSGYYTVTTGNTDTIASILLRYASTGVTYNSFLNCNPGVWAYVNYYYLPAGLTLCIPTTSYSIGYNYPYFYYNWYNYYPYNTYYTCSKAYVVVSGDICYSIVSRLGINLAYLYVCNPSINSGCTNLQPGQVLRY